MKQVCGATEWGSEVDLGRLRGSSFNEAARQGSRCGGRSPHAHNKRPEGRTVHGPIAAFSLARSFILGGISLFSSRPSCIIQLSRTCVLPSTEAHSPHALGYHRVRS